MREKRERLKEIFCMYSGIVCFIKIIEKRFIFIIIQFSHMNNIHILKIIKSVTRYITYFISIRTSDGIKITGDFAVFIRRATLTHGAIVYVGPAYTIDSDFCFITRSHLIIYMYINIIINS